MSEGGIVMPSSCAAATFHVNNNNNNNNNNNKLPKRKFSFPAALHSHHLQSDFSGGGVDFGCVGGPSLAVATARRRFSNVSDVVSRKLSHTIGWRTAVPTEQIARQGKALCAQYVRWKLRRSGAYTKRCAVALRRARTEALAEGGTSDDDASGYFIPARGGSGGGGGCCGVRDHDDAVRREVFPAVLRVGLHLERLDPKLYAAGPSAAAAAAAARSATSTAASEDDRAATQPPPPPPSSTHRPVAAAVAAHRLRGRDPAADAAASVVLVAVSRELFRAGAQVTWAKVVSLVCVAAGLAVDCARRGRAEQLPDLIEAVGEVIEDDLAAWIHYNGGWMGLQSYCKPVMVNVENPVSTQILYLMSVLVLVILFLLLLRWFDFISVFR